MLACVAGGEFRIKTGAKRGKTGALGLMMKGPLDSQVCVPHAAGGLVPRCSLDDEIGDIYIEFKIVGQAIVELEIGGVLTDVGILKLEGVVLIKELEVPFPPFGHPGVIGIERQLRVQRRTEAEQRGQRQP